MNLHQVLTGAVNPGDSCFSVGNVGEQPFTVSVQYGGTGGAGGGGEGAGSQLFNHLCLHWRMLVLASSPLLPPTLTTVWSENEKECSPFYQLSLNHLVLRDNHAPVGANIS